MIALTQKFSATLATIAEAVKRGEVSGEQAREMSAEQYQVTHMQFELLSLWRGIEEQDLARIPDVEAKPDSTQESEVVMVALPFNRRCDQKDSSGQRWSHAAKSCTAGGSGTVWDAGSNLSGSNRSGVGTSSGWRCSDNARVATWFSCLPF